VPTAPPTAPPKPPAPPTPRLSPTTKPIKSELRPPCPGTVDGPPGHNKGAPDDRPCGNGNGKDKDTKGGAVVVLPLAVSALALRIKGPAGRSLRRRRTAR
jgi:hypothetical protein